MPGAQRLRYAPCLGEAALRHVGRIAVHDFADLPMQASERGCRAAPDTSGPLRIAIQGIVRPRERAEQPRPYRALVIGTVALTLTATVVADVTRILGVERAQALRGEQFPRAGPDHRARTRVVQKLVRQ